MGSRHSSLRYTFEDMAFVFAGFVLKALPIRAASWLSGQVWRALGPRVSRRHDRALINLALAYPDRDEAELISIACDMWENLGRTFAESFRLREIASGARVTLETRDVIGSMATAQGHIVCAAHQANWEIAVLAIPATQKPPAGVYQRIKNPRVDARVRAMRAFLYPGGLYPKNSQTARQLIRHAREGGTIAMLADQRDFHGMRVSFFGRPAPSTPFPAMVARTYGLKLYAGEIIRRPGVRFTIRLVEIKVRKTEDRDRDVFEATAAIQREFERSIRANPGQWMWSHRRWG